MILKNVADADMDNKVKEIELFITNPVEYAEGPDDEPGEWKLYDMRTDKTEITNLADQHPEVVLELKALYEQWIEEMEQYKQLEMVEIRR